MVLVSRFPLPASVDPIFPTPNFTRLPELFVKLLSTASADRPNSSTIAWVFDSGVPGENEKLARTVSLSGVSKNSKLTRPENNKLTDMKNKQIVASTVNLLLA